MSTVYIVSHFSFRSWTNSWPQALGKSLTPYSLKFLIFNLELLSVSEFFYITFKTSFYGIYIFYYFVFHFKKVNNMRQKLTLKLLLWELNMA